MKTSWKTLKLGSIAPFIYGKSLTAQNRLSGEYDVYSSGGICGKSDKKLAENGIIVGRKGSAGSLFYSKRPFFCIDTAFYIDKVSSECDIKFIYYYMQLLRLESFNNDAAVPGLNRNLAHNLKVTIPDLSTQKRIADILSAYDDLIENNNRRIAILEKSAQELYKEWFVRLRFPNYEKTKFVNGLPEGWEVKTLGSLTDIASSKRVYLSEYVENGIPFYRSKEIIHLRNGQDVTNPLFISNEQFQKFDSKFGSPKKYDILITSVGTIGKSYLSDGHVFYFKDGNLLWLKTSQNINLALFLYTWLQSEEAQKSLLASSIGTSQSALTIENLKKVKVLTPKASVLADFFDIIISLKEKNIYLQQQNANLAKQRDLLLPRFLSGKLEV